MQYFYVILAVILIPLADTPPARAQNDPSRSQAKRYTGNVGLARNPPDSS